MDLLSDPCVVLWKSRLKSSFLVCFRVFERWVLEDLVNDPMFRGLPPCELVEWQSHATGREAMRLRVRLQLWIDGMSHLRYKTKLRYFSDVSSFFLHNFAPFLPDPSFSFRSDVEPVTGCLNVEAFRRIVLNSDARYKSVFLMMAQGLMGEGELMYVNENLASEVIKHVTRNDGVFSLTIPGRKRTRNREGFCTFLSTKSDWAESFRSYLKTVKHDVSSVLFVNNYGQPVSGPNIQQYFNSRAVESGVIRPITPECKVCGGETTRFRNRQGKNVPRELWRKTGYRCEGGHVTWAFEVKDFCFENNRYGVNPHEIRDLMRTRWESSGANWKVAEFMMGHLEVVDKNSYLSWSKYEKHVPLNEYRKALPFLNVLSCDPSKVDKVLFEEETEELRKENAELKKNQRDMERRLKDIEEAMRKVDWETP